MKFELNQKVTVPHANTSGVIKSRAEHVDREPDYAVAGDDGVPVWRNESELEADDQQSAAGDQAGVATPQEPDANTQG